MQEEIGAVKLETFDSEQGPIYNEGDDVEEFLLKIVQSGEDIQSTLACDKRWPVLYQLSPERENIVTPMNILASDRVLEIGSGMGAITGAIARKCAQVDCVELSRRRSLVNAYRHRTASNITIHIGNFERFASRNTYDVALLIGVFEYAQSYIGSTTPYRSMLDRVYSMLNPGGRIYIAIENKLGMKYLAGACEDHLGVPFIGIEGYPGNESVKTFSRSQLTSLVEAAGYRDIYYYYPMPDYKLPSVIYSDDYMPDESFSIPYLTNYDYNRLICFDEKLAYKGLIHSEEIKMVANSFLLEAVK